MPVLLWIFDWCPILFNLFIYKCKLKSLATTGTLEKALSVSKGKDSIL